MPRHAVKNTERTFKPFHPELGLLTVNYRYVRRTNGSATEPPQPPEVVVLDVLRRVDEGVWVSILGKKIEAEDEWLIGECFDNWSLEAAKR